MVKLKAGQSIDLAQGYKNGYKRYKPKTPGLRFLVAIDGSSCGKVAIKKLTESIKSSGGRNNHGHITVKNRWP